MKLGLVAVLCCFAAVTAAAAHSSIGARDALPCRASFHRLPGGTGLGLSLTCTKANVAVVRVAFPPIVRLRAQTPFPGAGCRLSDAYTVYCLFPSGAKTAKALTGTVRFAKAIPHARQRARVIFNLATFSSGADSPPGTLTLDPNAEIGIVAY
jgi:hypothetical protein